MTRDYEQDTISAIATPMGEGGIGIVRVSGSQALSIAGKIFVPKNSKPVNSQKNFTANYGRVVSAQGKKEVILDESLLLVMRGPHSYTGEDVVEIQAHGGPALLHSILQLTVRHGARLALPGEFTKRAFLNGRLDLLQAEAVLDLIQAKTERAALWAAAQLEGRLSKKIRSLREGLLEILTHLEAAVDFPEDFPEADSLTRIDERLAGVAADFEEMLRGSELGILAKRGIQAVLCGRPNVGKSSLLNQLTRKNRVIVTPYPGTTRDVVEEEALIHGFPVRFQDTAGVQQTDDLIEKEGVERSRRAMRESDLVLLVLDASQDLQEGDRLLLKELAGRPMIVVLNKSDLPRKLDVQALISLAGAAPVVSSNCVSDNGCQETESQIHRSMTKGHVEAGDEPLLSSTRQKELLEEALAAVLEARKACSQELSYEFIAADVRRGMESLGAVVGEVYNQEVLDLLFSRFCIGK